MKSIVKAAIAGAALLALSAPAFAAGDAAKGEKTFRKCASCHAVGEGAKNKVGPQLNGLFGRTAGTAEKYKYSKINKTAGENGLVWTPETVAAYLPNPQTFLKDFLKEAGAKASGRTKMSYRLRKDADVQDVIAYLKTHSPDFKPEGEAEPAEGEAAAAEGEAATQ